MSYDLIFAPKTDDQSWEEALEALQEAGDGDDEGDPVSPEVWAGLLEAAQQVLGEVEVTEDDDYYELKEESTGIELSYFPGNVEITTPYGYSGDRAKTIVTSLYRLAEAVQEITGLPGYDPQVELPVSEAISQPDLAVTAFDRAAALFAERGITTPGDD
jgi:hypothetical protein